MINSSNNAILPTNPVGQKATMLDVDKLETDLMTFFPGLAIESHVKTESGQRIVFFGNFKNCEDEARREWGSVAVKVAKHLHPNSRANASLF